MPERTQTQRELAVAIQIGDGVLLLRGESHFPLRARKNSPTGGPSIPSEVKSVQRIKDSDYAAA